MRPFKSLYDLRQSPTNWWNTIDEHMVKNYFKRFKPDPCVDTYSEGGVIVVLALYTDDVLLLGEDRLMLAGQAEADESFINDGHVHSCSG